jgi:gas vesicle protein
MAEKIISNASYFLVGLGIGSLIGILSAPKSGEETREYMSQKAKDGSEYAQKKARELKERAEDLVEHGKEVVMQKKEQIATAVDAGREAYQRGRSKAQGA